MESIIADQELRAYLREIGRAPRLDADRERELARRVRAGEPRARAQFITANLRLVVYFAQRIKKRGRSPLRLSDMIQAGSVGLINAVDKFDPERGARFSSYAAPFISHAILDTLAAEDYVRLPAHIRALAFKWRRAETQLRGKLGREPNARQIAGSLQLSRRQVARVRKALDVLENRQIDPAWNHAAESARPRTPPPDVAARVDVDVMVRRLDTRRGCVIRQRFGLGGPPRTLQEVGDGMHLSRERVRQLETDGLQELRRMMPAEVQATYQRPELPIVERTLQT